jgi:uncharacterized 2Fe-2S/4Fe-4S cluster protein (DUF4445 family)
MPQITFLPAGATIEVPAGSELLDAAKKAGISVEAPCGGHGICGKCLVKIISGRVDFDNSSGIFHSDLLADGFVLICKTKVTDEPVCVQITSQLDKEQGKFSKSADDIVLINKDLLPKIDDIDPLVKKIFLTVPSPSMGDGLSDYDRLKRTILSNLNGIDIEIPIERLIILPNVLREADGKITTVYFQSNNCIHIVDIEIDDTTKTNYGVAVDIGTTTIAVNLVDIVNGEIIASKTDYNAQIECGLDVISRINYAKKPERLYELKSKVLKTINNIIAELTTTNKIETRTIYNASIAGNTTMVHLLMGIIPEYIRLEPYTPAVYYVPNFKAIELGITINPNSYVYIAPSVGSYVGGDITSGILCTSLATDSEELCLFIDIGTNGELIIGNNDFLLGCACSAGPAFEGGGIENGMRASQGAIERVEIDKSTGIAAYSTIGNVPPIGICGSGMISLIAELFLTGWIDAAGRLNRNGNCRSIEVNGKNARYIIAPVTDNPDGKPIFVTEADIDNLIRAKAAIFSACRVMLQNVEMDFNMLSKMYIAGGFGRYLDVEKSITLGLLPDLSIEKFHFIGNSSIIGAYMTLLSKKHRELQTELSQKITYLDLSVEPNYMEQYTAALFLPHTDLDLFPNVKKN